MLGRRTLKSGRARARQIDIVFEHIAQVMLLSYALFVFVSWLTLRPAFQVTEVVIDGIHAVKEEGVAAVANDALSSKFLWRVFRNNIVFFPRERMLHDIVTLDPRIASVSLSFDSRHTLRIAINEYTVSALFCQSDDPNVFAIVPDKTTGTTTALSDTGAGELPHCYYADEQGYVFADAAEWSGHPYMTFLSSSTAPLLRTYILPKEEYANVNKFLASLSAINLRPNTVTILGNSDFRITTALPWNILWSSKEDPQKSADNLALVLTSLKSKNEKNSKELESIDLRFGNKIFYK
jgi:hypothetical protein